jgi:hypothetical protein
VLQRLRVQRVEVDKLALDDLRQQVLGAHQAHRRR